MFFFAADRLLPGQRGALWLHLMHYCETCTSPKMPEYLLYTYHTEYSRLPWKDLHPDQTLMNQFFNVRNPLHWMWMWVLTNWSISFMSCCSGGEGKSKELFPVYGRGAVWGELGQRIEWCSQPPSQPLRSDHGGLPPLSDGVPGKRGSSS